MRTPVAVKPCACAFAAAFVRTEKQLYRREVLGLSSRSIVVGLSERPLLTVSGRRGRPYTIALETEYMKAKASSCSQ